MYHVTDIRRWWHHIHLHEAMVRMEKGLLDRRVWFAVGAVLVLAGLITLVIWLGPTSGYSGRFYPYTYPFRP